MLELLENRIKKNDSWRLNSIVLNYSKKRINEKSDEIDFFYILTSSDDDVKELIMFFLDLLNKSFKNNDTSVFYDLIKILEGLKK